MRISDWSSDVCSSDLAVDTKALAAAFGVDAGNAIVSVPIWTTTPWTLPASLAVTLGAELEYVLVRGPERHCKAVLLVLAQDLAEAALQRYGVAACDVLGRARGAALRSEAHTSALPSLM